MANDPRNQRTDDPRGVQELLHRLRTHVPPGTSIKTLTRGSVNHIADITDAGVLVETDRSRAMGNGPQLVPAWMLSRAWEYLQTHGRMTHTELLSTEALNVKRSAAVMALLAQLPEVDVHYARPGELRLRR